MTKKCFFMIWCEECFTPLKIDKSAHFWYDFSMKYVDDLLVLRVLFWLSDDSSPAFYL